MSRSLTLHAYQQHALDFLNEKPYASLYLDPGLGKTAIVLSQLARLKEENRLGKTLIVAPLRVAKMTWPLEIQKWEEFSDLTFSLVLGAAAKRIKALEVEADVYLINYENLEWLAKQYVPKGFSSKQISHPFKLLVLDEVSYLKNPNTKRFKSIQPLIDGFTRRVALTGSPAPNSLLNLWGPMYCIDRGARLGSNYFGFRNEYFYPAKKGNLHAVELDRDRQWIWVPKPNDMVLGPHGRFWVDANEPVDGGEKRIYAKLSDTALRMSAIEHLDMPELMINDIEVGFESAKHGTVYDMFEEPYRKGAEDEKVAKKTVAHTTFCAQIANGFLYKPKMSGDPDERTYLDKYLEENAFVRKKLDEAASHQNAQCWFFDDAKIQATKALVEELQGQPLLVAFEYGADRDALLEAFPDAEVLGASGADENDLVNRWNRGEIEMLLANPRSVGHGLNLQGFARHILWYALPWSLELYEQFNARLWRQGQQHKSVIIHRLLREETVDHGKKFALERKNNVQTTFLQQLVAHAREKAYARQLLKR